MNSRVPFFRKFLALPLSSHLILAEIGVVSLFVQLLLAFIPFRFLRSFIETHNGLPIRSAKSSSDLEEVKKMTAAFFRRVPMDCLPSTLVLLILFRRRGLRPRFQVGLKKEGKTLKAHAWLEEDAQSLLFSHDYPEVITLKKAL